MKKKLLILSVLISEVVFAGCGNEMKKYAGEYEGTDDSYIKLIEDGTCIYSQPNLEASSGTWYIEDGTIYFEADGLGYSIYADINKSDSGLLFQSSSSRLNDEYFNKKD